MKELSIPSRQTAKKTSTVWAEVLLYKTYFMYEELKGKDFERCVDSV
jgi:hypothetical protein